MSALGSLIGCLALYAVGRKGGEVFLRKRFKASHVERGLRIYEKYGLLAVIVPALLPPPMPFKIFVLMAGAGGVSALRFVLTILVGRGLRYFGQGWLAVTVAEVRGLGEERLQVLAYHTMLHVRRWVARGVVDRRHGPPRRLGQIACR